MVEFSDLTVIAADVPAYRVPERFGRDDIEISANHGPRPLEDTTMEFRRMVATRQCIAGNKIAAMSVHISVVTPAELIQILSLGVQPYAMMPYEVWENILLVSKRDDGYCQYTFFNMLGEVV
jgi:hypothetical protein